MRRRSRRPPRSCLPAELRVHAAVVVLAIGAYDRPGALPGWDLPGVLTVGGAQALLKGNGVAVGPRVLVAGTGPFLLPVATALAARGAEVLGVHEANRAGRWLRQLPAALRSRPSFARPPAMPRPWRGTGYRCGPAPRSSPPMAATGWRQ